MMTAISRVKTVEKVFVGSRYGSGVLSVWLILLVSELFEKKAMLFTMNADERAVERLKKMDLLLLSEAEGRSTSHY